MAVHSALHGCSSLLLCAQHAWLHHPMRTAALSGLVVLAFLALSVYSLVLRLLSINDRPLATSIELEYPEDVKLALDEHLRNETARVNAWSLPLSTRGRHIVGADGRKVRLASVNWYGASDVGQVPGGLDVQHRDLIAAAIHRLGFNSVRLPYSDEMVRDPRPVAAALVAANPDLAGRPALDVFVAVARCLTAAGLAVIVNNHITESRWCCDGAPCDLLWANAWLGPLCRVRQSEADWIANWTSVMRRLAHDPLVVAADLRNEPRGLFGARGWRAWAAAAERAAAALHALNPAWLVVVEGTGSANHLHHAARCPVRLAVPRKLVYSAHVYGWSGWGAGRPYWSRSYAAFAADMRRNWAFLLEADVAPVWVGEFGAPAAPRHGDAVYWRHLVRFLHELGRPDFAYWALNPVKPGGWDESYSLVHGDWITPRRDYRMLDMLALMGALPGEEDEL